MNFTRNEFALYIAAVTIVFVVCDVLAVNASMTQRIVAFYTEVGVLLGMRWIANTYSDEAIEARRQERIRYWARADAESRP